MDKVLEELLKELQALLEEIKAHASQDHPTAYAIPNLQSTEVVDLSSEHPESPSHLDLAEFFASVRGSLFGGRLQALQVSGMEAKLREFQSAGFPLAWAAYALATSYHETARRMQPVREGLQASESWRKRNLRYYPYYGRGDVQLTWKENYEKADRELGLNGALVRNLDLALDPSTSAKIMVRGMTEGWFSGDSKGRHTLVRHLPDNKGTAAQFKQARRIINLMDKADLIASYAIKFQEALEVAGYGNPNIR